MPQLDYAEPLPLHRRRKVHRWLIGAAVLTKGAKGVKGGKGVIPNLVIFAN